MFCKNCGKELSENTNFCPSCGYKLDESTNIADSNPIEQNKGKTEDTIQEIKKLNPFVIASMVLVFIGFFIDYYGILRYTALVLAIIGLRQINKGNGKGKTLAIVCMAVAGVLGFIAIIRIIEYAQYSASTYGAMDGLFSWIESLSY